METIIELSDSDELAKQPPGTLIQLAGTSFLYQRNNASIRLLEITQRHYPDNFWVSHYLGTALAAAHQPPLLAESLRYLTAAVSLRPTSIGARINLVESLARAGEHRAARRLPSDAASRFYYGVSLEYSGNSEAAIGEYEAALQLRPDYDAARE